MNNLNIILVDDHHIVRSGIKSLLIKESYVNGVREASDYEELKQLIAELPPDLIILDISLPDISGIDVVKELRKSDDSTKILMLSMHTTDEFVFNSLKAGANGYLPKNTSKRELLEAINSVMEGNDYLSDQITGHILKGFVKKAKNQAEQDFRENLSKREMQILKLFLNGHSNKEIADQLYISVRTVESHKNHIMQKLKLKTTVDLIKYGIKNNIIEL